MILRKIRFLGTVAALQAATVLFVINAFQPVLPLVHARTQIVHAAPPLPVIPERKITAGKPIRIVINRLGIDLPIDDGIYNEADGTWTLSKQHAQFALITSPANDYQGNTLVYGHNSRAVFVRLPELVVGDVAELYTDNGHIFSYTFKQFQNYQPDDVSIFNYQGPPKLTIQTCGGDWYQYRQLFEFKLTKVEQ